MALPLMAATTLRGYGWSSYLSKICWRCAVLVNRGGGAALPSRGRYLWWLLRSPVGNDSYSKRVGGSLVATL